MAAIVRQWASQAFHTDLYMHRSEMHLMEASSIGYPRGYSKPCKHERNTLSSRGMRGLMCSARATGFARLLRLSQGCLALPLSMALAARLLRPLSGRSRWLVIPRITDYQT